MVMNAAERLEMFPHEPEMSALETEAAFAASLARIEASSGRIERRLTEAEAIMLRIEEDVKKCAGAFSSFMSSFRGGEHVQD